METFKYAQASPLKKNANKLGMGALLVIVPLVYPFGVRLGSLHLLGPIPTTIILVAVGLYLLVTAFLDIQKSNKLNARNSVITIDEVKLTYPVVEKGEVIDQTILLSDIIDTDYDQDEEILTVKPNTGKGIKFESDYFETPEHFKKFLALILK